MENKKLIEVKFQDLTLEVQKDDTYEWLLDTKSVAEGYGVAVSTIRDHKNNKNELLEGIHFLSVGISDAQKMGLKFTNKTRKKTYWTKRGVINLGFHIKSERAIRFRYWAEDLILGLEKSNQDLALKDYFDSKFSELKTDLKDYVDRKNIELKTDLEHYVDRKHKELKLYIDETTFTKQDFANHVPMFAEFMNFVWNTIDTIRNSQKEEQKLLHNFSKDLKSFKADAIILIGAIKRILASANTMDTQTLYYVYLVESETQEQHKFGMTDDVYRRKKELERWDNLLILHKIPINNKRDAGIIEKLLKHLFSDKHLKGEWFSLNDEDIILVKSL